MSHCGYSSALLRSMKALLSLPVTAGVSWLSNPSVALRPCGLILLPRCRADIKRVLHAESRELMGRSPRPIGGPSRRLCPLLSCGSVIPPSNRSPQRNEEGQGGGGRGYSLSQISHVVGWACRFAKTYPFEEVGATILRIPRRTSISTRTLEGVASTQ